MIERGATIVSIAPTEIWCESDFLGSRHVVLQHKGCTPFTYASFHYSYYYTDNFSIRRAAEALAIRLGASRPVVWKERSMFRTNLSADDRSEISKMAPAKLRAERNRLVHQIRTLGSYRNPAHAWRTERARVRLNCVNGALSDVPKSTRK